MFEPVTHAAQFIDVKGEPTASGRTSSLVFNNVHAPTGTIEMRPGPLRLSLENRTDARVAAGGLDRRRHAARPARQAPAVPDRQAPADQPDLPRHLSHRHARRRPAAEDHQPHLPVHRPQGLDRALRAGRRPRRLRSGARAFPRAARDRRRRGRRRGQDHRRRGDGDLPDARPRARRGAAHARGDARPQRRAQARGPAAEDRHPRGAVPRGHAQRPAGLFRPDRQHRLARAGPRRRRARSSPPSRWWRIRRSRR